MRIILISIAALGVAGCASINEGANQYVANLCTNAGYGVDHPQHQECIVNTHNQMRAQEQAELGAMLGIAAGIAAAQQSATASYPTQTQRIAPLIGQGIQGYNRTCQYKTPTQVVTLTVGGGQSCPSAIPY